MSDESMSPEAELARLADGSLPAERVAELRKQVESSPALAEALSEQERAIGLVRAVDVSAPDALRARIEAMAAEAEGHESRGRRRSERRRGGWRRALVLPIAAAAAVAVAAVVIATGGGTAAPTVAGTGHLALAASTMPAPLTDKSHHGWLAISTAGITFPDWSYDVGWRTTGARTDTLDGRRVVTVFYGGSGGARVGYSIVSGSPLSVPHGQVQWHGGTAFTLTSDGSTRLITWRQNGHTCVIAGRNIPDSTLIKLATAEAPQAA